MGDREDGSGEEPFSPARMAAGPAVAAGTETPLSGSEIAGWRRRQRQALIAQRLAHSAEGRARAAVSILRRLTEVVGEARGRKISLYWPFRGEPDLRPFIAATWQQGGVALLPVVVERGRPLQFRSWRPGERLERGIWDIPVPADGTCATPDVVIAPVVGFDGALYRLGYGGGYFDRTLAQIREKPLVIGVGYGSQAIATIRPQPHDIPMDTIITADVRED